MTAAIGYVLKNTNSNRGAFYEDSPSFWLEGDYITHSSGATDDNIYRAKIYLSLKTAQSACDRVNEKFGVNGTYFHSVYGYRYPDSCGKKGYSMYAPRFVVVTIEQMITEC